MKAAKNFKENTSSQLSVLPKLRIPDGGHFEEAGVSAIPNSLLQGITV